MLIVDGHNVAFADARAREALTSGRPDKARGRVLDLVEAAARAARQQATVVFDGAPPRQAPEPRGRVTCVFAGPDRSADLEVLGLVQASTGRSRLCVVSSDRSLLAGARRLGAATLGSAEFLKQVARTRAAAADQPPPEPAGKRFGPSPAEVERLLKVFTEDDVARIEEEESDDPQRTR